MVVGELLDERASITYTAEQRPDGKIQCPVDGYLGVLKDGWNMRRHFRDIHSWDKVIVKKEGQSYLRCGYCGMQTNPAVRGHWRTESCSIGSDRRVQHEVAVTSALALRCTFTVHGDVLERVEVFKYLGRLLTQDDNDIQALRQQIRKARGIWAHVSQVLRGENATPHIAAKFYTAVVQSVLLYGSETWNLTQTVLARWKGFISAPPTGWLGNTNLAKVCSGI